MLAKKIMLTGGGTLGPVTPLLALVEVWKQEPFSPEVIWVGTANGPEKTLVREQGIPFQSLSVPKLDRHAPAKWIFIPFWFAWSLWCALKIIRLEKPDVIVSAGAYVSVPLVWIGKLLGAPVWIHQQDARPGLANRLMAPMATSISVAWLRSLVGFSKHKTLFLGNPVRSSIWQGERKRIMNLNNFSESKPMVLVFGGGTGSQWINQVIAFILPELLQTANVIHISGTGKQTEDAEEFIPGYVQKTFVTSEMADLYAAADLVICRAGMGTISELSALKKTAIVIPIPASHQEENAAALDEFSAAIILHQSLTSPQILLQTINGLLSSKDFMSFGARLHAALPTEGVADKLAHHIESLAKSQDH